MWWICRSYMNNPFVKTIEPIKDDHSYGLSWRLHSLGNVHDKSFSVPSLTENRNSNLLPEKMGGEGGVIKIERYLVLCCFPLSLYSEWVHISKYKTSCSLYRCLVSKLYVNQWNVRWTTSSPLMVHTSTIVTWRCCVISWRAEVIWWL